MSGRLELVDRPDRRDLLMRGQVQGGSFLHPSAREIDQDLEGPGPIPACRYMAGWLGAGVHSPTGSGLMIGLGSGAGAVALLHQFPKIDLTLVEIDPEVIKLAREGFPLIQYYEDQGRLNLIQADAGNYLDKVDDTWDFGLCDAYTGENSLVHKVVVPTIKRVDRFWANVIDYGFTDEMDELLGLVNQHSKYGPVTGQFNASGTQAVLVGLVLQNWIITNCALDLEKLDQYTPFEEFEGDGAEFVRGAYVDLFATNHLEQ